MEVRHQRADHTEIEAWINEHVGCCRTRLDGAAARLDGMLERTRRRRADYDDATAIRESAIEGVRSARRDLVVFGIDLVLFDQFGSHWFERAVADVKRDRHAFDAARVDGPQ